MTIARAKQLVHHSRIYIQDARYSMESYVQASQILHKAESDIDFEDTVQYVEKLKLRRAA